MESVIQSGEELLNRLIKLKEDDDLSRIGKLFRTNSNCIFTIPELVRSCKWSK